MDSIVSCFGDIVTPTKDNPSDSSLYVTDIEAIQSIQGIVNDESNEFSWSKVEDRIDDSIRIAKLRLHTDLSTLMLRYAKPRVGFLGNIGSTRFTNYIADTGKSGLRMLSNAFRDVEAILTGVTLTFKESGSIDLYLASNRGDGIETLSGLTTVAGKPKYNELTTPISLELYDNTVDGYVEYYLYHENDLTAADTKIECSTCNKFAFNSYTPSFKTFGYKQYMIVGGFNGEIDSLKDNASNQGKGIMLHMDIRCDTTKAICTSNENIKRSPMYMSYATAIQYKAASNLIWDMIRSPKLNRIVMGGMESFRDAATFYDRKYNDMIKYISKNMDIESDCFCEHGFTKSKISHAG